MNTATLQIAIEVDDKGSVKLRQLGETGKAAADKGEKATRNWREQLSQLKGSADISIGSLTRLAGVSFAALAAGIATTSAAVTAMITGTAASARELENHARTVGTSVAELQRLASATSTVNITQEKLADISKDVKDKLGDFIATGGGEFADFWELVAPKIGMTAQQLQGLSGPQALQALKNGMDAANLSMEEQIFYLEGIANDASLLEPLLRNNGAAMAELANRAKDLGLGLSSIETKNLTDADAAIRAMRTSSTALKEHISAALAPAVTDVATKLVDGMTDGEGGVTGLAESISAKLLTALGYGIETLRFFHNGWLGIKLVGTVAIDAIAQSLEFLYTGLRQVLLPIDMAYEGLVKLGVVDVNPFDKIGDALGTFATSSRDVTNQVLADIESTNAGYDSIKSTIDGWRNNIGKTAETEKQAITDVDAARDASTLKYKENLDAEVAAATAAAKTITDAWLSAAQEKAAADERALAEEDYNASRKLSLEASLTDEINRLTMDKTTYYLSKLDEEVEKMREVAGTDMALQDQITAYQQAKTAEIIQSYSDRTSALSDLQTAWEEFEKNSIKALTDAFIKGENTKTAVAKVAQDVLAKYAADAATKGLSKIIEALASEIGAWVGLGAAQTSTEGNDWKAKLASAAGYLAGAAAAVLAGKAIGNNVKADGGWLADNPNGGYVVDGNGIHDDVFAGFTHGGSVSNWIMGGEFVINQETTKANLPFLRWLNSQRRKVYADGGPVSEPLPVAEDINDSGFDTFATEFVRSWNWKKALAVALGYYAGSGAAMIAGKEYGKDIFFHHGGQLGSRFSRRFGLGDLLDDLDDLLDPLGMDDMLDDGKDWIEDNLPGGDWISEYFGMKPNFAMLWDSFRQTPIFDDTVKRADTILEPFVRAVLTPGKSPTWNTVEDMIENCYKDLEKEWATYLGTGVELGWFFEELTNRDGGLLGQLHNGIDYVPKTGTYLLEEGERVTPAAGYNGDVELLAEVRGLREDLRDREETIEVKVYIGDQELTGIVDQVVIARNSAPQARGRIYL